ncbi:DUF1294 domain-containing protein [Roseobacteraceae bacterium NS-SX3]
MQQIPWLAAGVYLASISAVAWLLFGWDKFCARRGWRRVSEAHLLGVAAIGGTLGAYGARAMFRHKTRKQPFSRWLHGIAALQGAAILFLALEHL